VRDRFFEVDVFAGGDGGDGDAHVPVVRGGNDDSVDAFIVEDLVEVHAGGGCSGGAGAGFYFVAVRGVDVAYGDNLEGDAGGFG
jgi:hypothetical protein